MKSILTAAALAAAAVLTAGTANAAPLGGLPVPVSENGLVQKIHNGDVHRSCELGNRGWHYHSRYRGRIECRPPRPGFRYWTWRNEGGRQGWYHSRDRRWN
jgi:hypothetical protein